jgi:hypothetical protein
VVPPPTSPEALFSRYLAGDAGALQELVSRLSPELRALARRMGADPEQSEDALQEMWLAAINLGRVVRRAPAALAVAADPSALPLALRVSPRAALEGMDRGAILRAHRVAGRAP